MASVSLLFKMNLIVALFSLAEILIFVLGFFVGLRRLSYPTAIALALAISSGLMLLSFLFQLGFLAKLPELIPMLEGFALIAILWLNWGKWRTIGDIYQAVVTIWREFPRQLTILAIALTYLYLQAVLLPPSSWDALTYHLPRVLLWEQNRTLFLQDFTIAPQAAFPVGSDILFHAFLRFHSDYGLGIFSWLSAVIIFLGTYGLVRPRVNRDIALTSAIAIGCLPEIVYQATATKNDIILAAIALVCVIWADRWLQLPSLSSLLGFLLTLCFGVAVKTSFILFAFFFVPLWFSLVIQQGKLSHCLKSIQRGWRFVFLWMIPAVVLSQCWLFFHNYQQFGAWLAPPEFTFNNQNNEGLFGGIANLVRYSFHSIHLLRPVDAIGELLTGKSMVAGLQAIYDRVFDPIFGNAGHTEMTKARSFQIQWQPQEDTSWFGPIGLFLVFPAVGWSLLKGRQLSRVMAIVAIGLVLAISYKIGWSPWKARFFTLVFVCTGVCVATFLQHFSVRKWVLSGIRWLSLVILIYGCLCNYNKPIIPASFYLSGENIWLRSDWTRDRRVYDRLYYGKEIDTLHQLLPSAKRVMILGYNHYFSVMFWNPEIEFILLQAKGSPPDAHSLAKIDPRLAEVDHLICFEKPCNPRTSKTPLHLVWGSDHESKAPQLYQVNLDNR